MLENKKTSSKMFFPCLLAFVCIFNLNQMVWDEILVNCSAIKTLEQKLCGLRWLLRWLKIKGIDAAFSIPITTIQNLTRPNITHKSFLGTLKVTSENNLNEHCVLTFNRKSKDTSTAEKSRENKLWNFSTICFQTLWNEWSEWSNCSRRTKVQKRR